jgi:hypothetical protein
LKKGFPGRLNVGENKSEPNGEVIEFSVHKGKKHFVLSYRPGSEDLSAFIERLARLLPPTWEADLAQMLATKDTERLKLSRHGKEVQWSEVFRDERILSNAKVQHEVFQISPVKRLVNRVRAEDEEQREAARERGKHPKRRDIIYQAIVDHLRKNPSQTNSEVWESFPDNRDMAETVGDNLSYSVFRDFEALCQEYSGGKKPKVQCIERRKFDDYMTDAREELKISTRTKKR